MVDLKEERQYERLRKLGQQLHIPIPEAFWELEVTDKNGKVIQRHRQRSHSWTRNAYNHLFCQLAGKDLDDDTFGAGKLSLKQQAGAIRHDDMPSLLVYGGEGSVDGLATASFSGGYRAPADNDEVGILVGSGVAAESFEDYILQTKIASGSGAGQLAHIQSEAHSITYEAGTKTLKNQLVRYFNNNSGGSVDVNELGLVCCLQRPVIPDEYLLSRDKLGATVSVPDTGQLKVTYTIQLTYPA